MIAFLFQILLGAGGALVAWLSIEAVLIRVLPRLEHYLPSDVVGPEGWLADTTGRNGIFDFPATRRQGPGKGHSAASRV